MADAATVTQARPPRKTRACKQCRISKVRCSGKRPCNRCARRGDACNYVADERHVSVPEPYLRELQRMAELQRDQQDRTQHQAGPAGTPAALMSLDAAGDGDGNDILEQSPVSAFAQQTGSVANTAAPATSHHLPARPGTSGRGGESVVTRDVAYVHGSDARRLLHLGHTSTWSFCRRAFALLEDAAQSPDSSRAPLNLDGTAFSLKWRPKLSIELSDLQTLPAVDYALFLFNTVKFRLGELACLVDEKEFLQVFDRYQQRPLEVAQSNVLWFVKYLVILAFGKAFSSLPTQTPAAAPPGYELVERALSFLPDIAFMQDDRPALEAMETLSLIALYFQSIDMRSPAYQYIGQAVRLALHDGLHRGHRDDIVDAALASRCNSIWWALYVLDQEFTAGLGCPSTVPRSSITTPLPDLQSASLSAKTLTLRTNLSELLSTICGCVYSLEDDLSSEFAQNTTFILHGLAQVSRQIDAVTSPFDAGNGELPNMLYNIVLYYHHCIVLATRPLAIWILSRTTLQRQFDSATLASPVSTLLEKSASSASTILLMLGTSVKREIRETFLPFQLEYAISARALLVILSAILPAYVPNPNWHRAASSVLEEFVKTGNVVAPLRKRDLEHLENLLRDFQVTQSTALRSSHEISRQASQRNEGMQMWINEADSHQMNDGYMLPMPDEPFGLFDALATDADDFFALAEQFESGDFSLMAPLE